jgi:lipopolysaccharide transport system permease protein
MSLSVPQVGSDGAWVLILCQTLGRHRRNSTHRDSTGMLAPNLVSAWRYRHFILSSIHTEFRARFARSKLGGVWMIIHPLAQAAIFALVLAEVMAAKLPGMANSKFAYAIYLLSGMLAWSLFAEIVSRCLTVFIDNGNLLKKMLFPRINLPLIIAGSALINNLLLLLAVLFVFALLGHIPGGEIAWMPLLILLTMALGLGVGLLLAVFNVFVRDVGQVVPIALQLGFWFTPIVYTPDVVPLRLRSLLHLNPMTAIVESFQNVMLFDQPPDFPALAWIFIVTLLLMMAALALFRRASGEMADVL